MKPCCFGWDAGCGRLARTFRVKIKRAKVWTAGHKNIYLARRKVYERAARLLLVLVAAHTTAFLFGWKYRAYVLAERSTATVQYTADILSGEPKHDQLKTHATIIVF